MIRYPKGRILNICSICVLYIFVFKIDIFPSKDKILNDNSCPEDNYLASEYFQEPSLLLEEEDNPGNDMGDRSYIGEEEDNPGNDMGDRSYIKDIINGEEEYNPVYYMGDRSYIKDIINGKEDYNQEGINMVGQNIYDDKNTEGNNIFCCSSGLFLKNQKNFETNYDFENYVDEEKGVANTSIRIKKKDLNLENLLLKKRKRRTNESIDNIKKKLANRKTNRGRYKKNDQSSINYVPNVNDYSDVRHSRYSLDNIILKIKTLIINEIIRFLNNKITEFYKWEDFYELLSKKTIIPPTFKYMFNQKSILFNLNGEFIKRMKKEHDKILLNQKIGVILSNEISKRVKNYESDHNKFIIEVIQKNYEIKKILDLTFLDCVKHFSLQKENIILRGFTDWNTYAEKIEEENDKKYKKCFQDVLLKFEDFVNSCWSRGKKKKSKNNCV